MLTFGNKLNRSYTMYLPFNENYISVSVYFSKTNTFIGFKPDSKTQELCSLHNCNITTYKDLSKSLFATTFLDIKDFKSDNLDIRQQFCNILKPHSDIIQYINNESIKLSKVTTNNGTFDSLLYIYGFTFTDYQYEFVYLLAERQHIDTVLNKKLVRTSSIQISTKDCLDNMYKLAEHYRGEKIDKNYESQHTYESEDYLSDLFPDKNKKINFQPL